VPRLTSGQSILEDLLEAQELENGQVDSWVEAKTALVRAESRVELHTETSVDLNFALVVFPGDSELEDTLWNGCDFERGLVLRILFEETGVLQGRGQLCLVSIELHRHFDFNCMVTNRCRPARILARRLWTSWWRQ
jgi:hypothetical protein